MALLHTEMKCFTCAYYANGQCLKKWRDIDGTVRIIYILKQDDDKVPVEHVLQFFCKGTGHKRKGK